MAVILTCIFAACDKGAKEKQVPVYKGMVISQSFASTSATTADDGEYVEPQHKPGHVEGDHEHRDDDFDQNKPFDDPNVPSIDDKAQSTLDVVGSAQNIYYADKNQDIYITIKLSNPDSYEILSFTLNGKKYSNYMFEAGSDMENLVLKVNVGNVGGIVEYTIDAIKYVDGTDIKDVRMDGDKTVKAGVRASDQTYVTVTNEQKTMTSISFDAQVVDSYSLIEKSGGYAKAVLYDGETLISKDVTVGEKASVVFDNLTPNTVYQYGVVALYDDLSGNGVQLNTLYKKAVYTDTIVLFKDVQVGKESISWNFEWNQSFANKQMNAISLWQNGAKVQDVDVNATSVDGLKSNNEYTLKATYKNIQNQDETIEILFVTYAKAVPTVEIENVESTQTGITFGLTIVDTDNVGAISKIELLHGNDTPIVATDFTTRSFANLLSNNDYTIRVTYTYDVNDGVGEQQIVKTADIKTKAKATPSVEIENVESTQTGITFGLNVVDADNVGAISKIELLHGNDTPIVATDLATRSFTNLLSNNDYTIRVTYNYDLNDGVGEQQIVKTADIKTKAKATPSVAISNFENTKDSISADVAFVDIDNIGEITSIVLKKGDTQIATTSERTHIVFDSLSHDTQYTIVITYKYDLNDGNGVQTSTQTAKRYTSPVFELVEVTCANTSAVSNGEIIYFEAKVNNPSGVVVDKIKINGRYYTPSGGTTKNSIIVNITVEDQFEGGNTALEVAEIEGTLHEQKVSLVLSENNVATVFVNGELVVKSIAVVDADGKECDIVVSGNQYYYIVSFENKTGYTIDGINSLVLANGDYTMIDAETAKIPVSFSGGSISYDVTSIAYSNSSLGNKTKYILNVSTSVVCVKSKTPVVITAAEQLKNMDDWQYYVLGNDIDLAGTEWKNPANFSGYFDGQGYSIKNMSYAGTVKNSNLYWGLFSHASGIIKNLSVSGRLIATTAADDGVLMDSNIGEAFVGGICGMSANLILSNVVSDVNISITNYVGNDIYNVTYVGGLVGRSYDVLTITDSYARGNIAVKGGYYVNACGLVGIANQTTIQNSYFDGNITAESRWGDSWFGFEENYSDALIKGGKVENCYYTDGESRSGGEKKTLAEIIEIMKTIWDSTIWDFDNLDGNGNPTLK